MDDSGRSARVAIPAGAVVVLLGAILVTGSFAHGVGLASGDHGPEGTDFTYEPMSPEDRRPGAEGTRVGTIGRGADGVDRDFETLLELRSVYAEGSWESCGPTSSEVFGIDRGGDNERYEVDESLTDNVKRFSAGEDVFEAEFYDEDEYGPSTHLNSDDRVVSIIECVDNPEEPGWYQIDVAAVTGRTPDGEVVTMEDTSHYFWICDCEGEDEARERLGPPPSEPDPTATPAGDGSGDETSSDDDPTGAATPGSSSGDDDTSGDGSDASGTATAAGTAATTRTADVTTATATDTGSSSPEEWAAYRVRTPTPGSGAGVSPVAAGVALLVAALLLRRV